MEQSAPAQLNADEFASLRELSLKPFIPDIPLQHQKRLLDLSYVKQVDGNYVVTEDGLLRLLIDDEAFQIASASCSIQLDLGKRSRLFDLCHLGYFFGSTPLANTATEASPSVFSLVLVDQIARANGQSAREVPQDRYASRREPTNSNPLVWERMP